MENSEIPNQLIVIMSFIIPILKFEKNLKTTLSHLEENNDHD